MFAVTRFLLCGYAPGAEPLDARASAFPVPHEPETCQCRAAWSAAAGNLVHLVVPGVSICHEEFRKALEEALRSLAASVWLVLKNPNLGLYKPAKALGIQ